MQHALQYAPQHAATHYTTLPCYSMHRVAFDSAAKCSQYKWHDILNALADGFERGFVFLCVLCVNSPLQSVFTVLPGLGLFSSECHRVHLSRFLKKYVFCSQHVRGVLKCIVVATRSTWADSWIKFLCVQFVCSVLKCVAVHVAVCCSVPLKNGSGCSMCVYCGCYRVAKMHRMP